MAMHPSTMTRADAEERAKTVFFVHLGSYLAVNAWLAYVDLSSSPERTWFFWPLAGWGIGVLLHGIGVFVTHRAADRVLARQAHRQERAERREARQAGH
jgi:hypothetical protein